MSARWSRPVLGALWVGSILAVAAPAFGQNLDQSPLQGQAFEAAERSYRALEAGSTEEAVSQARQARQLAPESEAAVRVLIDALSRAGRRAEALRQADAAIARGGASGQLLAQRGFLLAEAGEPERAAADFRAALERGGLGEDQIATVREALEQVRFTSAIERAFAASAAGDHGRALGAARQAQRLRPSRESPARIIIEALSQLGRSGEALEEASRVIARGGATGQLHAQRGYLLRERDAFEAAAADFEAALSRGVEVEQQQALRFALAEARSRASEARGRIAEAAAFLRSYLASEPTDANAWFTLGYLYRRQGRNEEAGGAFLQGLQHERRGDILVEAGYALLPTSAVQGSALLREAVDAWNAGDPSLAGRPARDKEALRNQIVQAEQSVRATMSAGTILGRTNAVGGDKTELAADIAARFDGRYLPHIRGLEAYLRGSWSRDGTDFRESDLAAGVRWRPFRTANLVLAAEWQRRFEPEPLDQFAAFWGYSAGGIGYPYEEGWRPYWAVGVFGSWRSREKRYLQDVTGSVGAVFASRTQLRYAAGPALLGVVSYDNRDAVPWAAGVGPGIVARTWLGGDSYRGYDAIVSLQMGYLFPIGHSERQSGWHVRVTTQF